MNILNNVKKLKSVAILALILMVFSNCQNENAIVEETNNLKLNDNFRLFSKPKKSKKILEDNVNGRLLYRHDEIYNYTYDAIANRCTTAQLSKIIFGVEKTQETSTFSLSSGAISIGTVLSGGRMPIKYAITFNPRNNYINSAISSNSDGSEKNIKFTYSPSGYLTNIVETNGLSGGGPGRLPIDALGETHTYSNFIFDSNKNITRYKLVITGPSTTGTTYKKIEEIVTISYFSTANIGSDLSPFPRMSNLNALDLAKISNLSYGLPGNKMIFTIVSNIKYYSSDGSGTFKSNTLKTTVTKDAANRMTKADRTNSSFPTNYYTSDEVYLIEYEY